MHTQTNVLLLAAGGAGDSVINALAGGATLITFPAMLAAGLPAVIANASNAVAISPGHLIAALADRGKLPSPTRRTISFVAVSTVGGAAGAGVILDWYYWWRFKPAKSNSSIYRRFIRWYSGGPKRVYSYFRSCWIYQTRNNDK